MYLARMTIAALFDKLSLATIPLSLSQVKRFMCRKVSRSRLNVRPCCMTTSFGNMSLHTITMLTSSCTGETLIETPTDSRSAVQRVAFSTSFSTTFSCLTPVFIDVRRTVDDILEKFAVNLSLTVRYTFLHSLQIRK